MTLKAIVESLDGLHESVASEYTARTGDGQKGFQLSVEAVEGIELAPVGNLRTALESERTAHQTVQQQVKDFEKKFGDLDPEVARAAISKIEELGDGADVTKQVEAAIAQKQTQLETKFATDTEKIRTDLTTELDTSKTESESLRTQLSEVMIKNEGISAISEAKGSQPLLLPIIQAEAEMRVNKTTGKREVVLVDRATGNVRLSTSSGSTANMTITERVAEMKASEDFGGAFTGSGAAGGGSSGGSTTNSQGGHSISEADASDVAKYRLAKAKADKAGVPLAIH